MIFIMSESTNNSIQSAYNRWAEVYDSNKNKTRDLEAVSIREVLSGNFYENCLEIGCGTGKNTLFLAEHSRKLTAVDFSEEMLLKAREKVSSDNVNFVQADINTDWNFAKSPYDLVTFSLVLEHIENLNVIFEKVKAVTADESVVYIGELHPFKQYTGTKARFETDLQTEVLKCFNHHVSDFTTAAHNYGFVLEIIREYFDTDGESHVPRILSLLFRKK